MSDNTVEEAWRLQLEEKLKLMKDQMVWLCLECYNEFWVGRALGLTSHDPEVCTNCGETSICVLMSSVRLNIRKEKKS